MFWFIPVSKIAFPRKTHFSESTECIFWPLDGFVLRIIVVCSQCSHSVLNFIYFEFCQFVSRYK